jgi:hypothetical protein
VNTATSTFLILSDSIMQNAKSPCYAEREEKYMSEHVIKVCIPTAENVRIQTQGIIIGSGVLGN